MVLPFYGEIYFENDIFRGVFTPIFPKNSLKKSNTMIGTTMTFRLFLLPNFAANQ
ncbi:hypothetical protein BACINT_03766 [Bacteroides intestinalis DSM 17393]|uniref:Uncharacterized protein n=1 Tax=Bacteroides intestinalis DSM 17393 TaxID=471870 RepID=B3CCB8_9BACE|nr:hypothetical protein BACINT_03766 [Bacteroides intestinalis DSM 17393]